MGEKKEHAPFFDTNQLNTNLKNRSLRSGAVTLTAQGLTTLINLGKTIVLARLLTPNDFGMIAMVSAITGFAFIFSDLGLSTATIQRADINQKQVSNLFWINAGLGAAITIIVAASSPVVAWFYKIPQLLWVTVTLSLIFVIDGLAIQHKALLTRQMRFLTIASVEVSSILLGIAVAIFMAMRGFRYWALVANILTTTTCRVICFSVVSKWRPNLPQRKSGVRSMLGFGSDIAKFNVINYFSRNLDNILIGRYYGGGALGLYSKAYALLMMPIMNLRIPMNRVAVPVLSRLQYEPGQYRSYYIKYISSLAFISMPLVALMFVCSDNIIRLVLGQQWMDASELFKILAVCALIQPVVTTQGAVTISTGQSRRYFWCGAGYACVVTLSFIVGIQWGARGVATAYTIANYLLIHPSLFYSYKNTPIRTTDFYASIYRPLVASVCMGLFCFFLQRSLSEVGDIIVLTVSSLTGIGFYLIVYIAISGGAKDLREYYSYGRLAFSKYR